VNGESRPILDVGTLKVSSDVGACDTTHAFDDNSEFWPVDWISVDHSEFILYFDRFCVSIDYGGQSVGGALERVQIFRYNNNF